MSNISDEFKTIIEKLEDLRSRFPQIQNNPGASIRNLPQNIHPEASVENHAASTLPLGNASTTNQNMQEGITAAGEPATSVQENEEAGLKVKESAKVRRECLVLRTEAYTFEAIARRLLGSIKYHKDRLKHKGHDTRLIYPGLEDAKLENAQVIEASLACHAEIAKINRYRYPLDQILWYIRLYFYCESHGNSRDARKRLREILGIPETTLTNDLKLGKRLSLCYDSLSTSAFNFHGE